MFLLMCGNHNWGAVCLLSRGVKINASILMAAPHGSLGMQASVSALAAIELVGIYRPLIHLTFP